MTTNDDIRSQAIAVTMAKVDEVVDLWHRGESQEAQGKSLIEEGAALKKFAQEQYDRLLITAACFGFDLIAESKAHREKQFSLATVAAQAPPNILARSMGGDAPAQKTIKDRVLDAARLAFPNPVRSSTLREQFQSAGIETHEKTIGMTLYRLLQQGLLHREKRDWYFVPQALDKNVLAESEQENPGDQPGLLAAAE
jgi:hypothetical protein